MSYLTDDGVLKSVYHAFREAIKKMDNANKKLWNRSKSIYAYI